MDYRQYQFFTSMSADKRFVVVLAGGDGLRLQPFVRGLRGDCLPKQYVKLINSQSLLEDTLRRAQNLVTQRQFVVVTKHHFDYPEVGQQLANYPKVSTVIQPLNRDTGLGLLFTLAFLKKQQSNATVAIFPSDHFIANDERFLSYVRAAYAFIEHEHSKIILLGIPPTYQETEYGYIVTGARWHNIFPYGGVEIERFVEKPNPTLTRELIGRGALWNTMVMVFKLKTLLHHLRQIRPQVYGIFQQIYQLVGKPNFHQAVEEIFEQAKPFNLSRDYLEALSISRSKDLLVLPVRGVHWSDWGSAERIRSTLKLINNDSDALAESGTTFHAMH